MLAAIVVGPLAAAGPALAAARRKRIGFVVVSPPAREMHPQTQVAHAVRLMAAGMRELGWTDGKDIEYHWRSAEGRYDRLDGIIAELVAMPVDVLVVHGAAVGRAVKRTRTIPIVMAATGSASVLRAGPLSPLPSNLTGTTFDSSPTLNSKRLSLLKAAVPGAKRIASAFDSEIGTLTGGPLFKKAADELKLTLIPAPYDLDDPVPGLERAARSGAQAYFFHANSGTQRRHRQDALHDWTAMRRMPAIHSNPEAADAGLLMALGPDELAIYARTPHFVDKILRGVRPAELPLEQPAVNRLVVNLRTARAIGVVIPTEVLIQADRVID